MHSWSFLALWAIMSDSISLCKSQRIHWMVRENIGKCEGKCLGKWKSESAWHPDWINVFDGLRTRNVNFSLAPSALAAFTNNLFHQEILWLFILVIQSTISNTCIVTSIHWSILWLMEFWNFSTPRPQRIPFRWHCSRSPSPLLFPSRKTIRRIQ